MANLKEVKIRIASVKSTQQITKAMKMVAAAKLRKAQDAIMRLRPYASKLEEILTNVSSTADDSLEIKYAEVSSEIKNVLIISVTSDRGLCGGFNSSIFKKTKATIAEKYTNTNLEILCIGKKANDHFKKNNFNVISDYAEILKGLSFDKVREVAEFAMDSFVEGKYDVVEIVYNEFKNVATQVVVAEQFLPIVAAPKQEVTVSTDYIFEPNKEFIVKDLIPKSLKIKVYKAVLESAASENGARMTAMDAATENAGELLKELKLTYNRSRQAAITTEILEIVGGAEALSAG